MKRILSILVVLCLLSTIIVPAAADEDVVLPPRDDGNTTDYEIYDDLVMPKTGAKGDAFILSDPNDSLFDEDNQKEFEGEPLIAPYNPELSDVVESSEEDWDGDGVPNDEDSCPTVYGEGEHGCPIGDDGTEAEVFVVEGDEVETEDDNGVSLSVVSIVAGVLLAFFLIVGIAIKKKK